MVDHNNFLHKQQLQKRRKREIALKMETKKIRRKTSISRLLNYESWALTAPLMKKKMRPRNSEKRAGADSTKYHLKPNGELEASSQPNLSSLSKQILFAWKSPIS